jgi:hypothetical protein
MHAVVVSGEQDEFAIGFFGEIARCCSSPTAVN